MNLAAKPSNGINGINGHRDNMSIIRKLVCAATRMEVVNAARAPPFTGSPVRRLKNHFVLAP